MLRKVRICVEALFLLGITLLFAGIGADWWGWMAKLQFMPSALSIGASAAALNIAVTAAILLVTLLFGRIYCSAICPLGIFQDVVNHISASRKGKSRRFHFRENCKWLRYGILLLFCLAAFFGVQLFVALIEPYSAYGRIVRSIVSPMGMGWAVASVAAVTLIAVALMAWFWGRLYCNTVCPTGTLLGIVSKYSIFRPVIDESKCVNCHSCEKKCKASCIDSNGKVIDYSRCVDCFDCIEDCKVGAISYKCRIGSSSTAEAGAGNVASKDSQGDADAARRAFLTGTAMAIGAVTLGAQEQKVDGGLAELEDKKKPVRTERIVPPGAKGLVHFYDKCTACQLCVSVCPNKVLRPSTDLAHFMQPEASFENGYCRPECSECSQVCPTGAILPVTPEEKTFIHVGHATVDLDLCVVNRDGKSCGNCSRHCPTQAIKMVRKDPKDHNSLQIPVVDEEKCIGCGACEYLCPSRPFSAIHVNGLKVHING